MNDKADKSSPTAAQALNTLSKEPLFLLGFICATPAALDLLEHHGVKATTYLARHQYGDFGSLCAEDIEENVFAVLYGTRILSAYDIGTDRIYVITEADRSVTTMLLTCEY